MSAAGGIRGRGWRREPSSGQRSRGQACLRPSRWPVGWRPSPWGRRRHRRRSSVAGRASPPPGSAPPSSRCGSSRCRVRRLGRPSRRLVRDHGRRPWSRRAPQGRRPAGASRHRAGCGAGGRRRHAAGLPGGRRRRGRGGRRSSRAPPSDDPYGEYLRRTGAAGSLRADTLRVLRPPPATSLQAFRDAPATLSGRPCPNRRQACAAGILIGLRERVDRDLAADSPPPA